MNAVQYYIIDSYIKKKVDPRGGILESAPGRLSSPNSHRRSFDSAGDVFGSSEEEEPSSRSLLRPSSSPRLRGADKKLVPPPVLEEYNPDTDGSTLQDGIGTPRSTSPSSSSYTALRSGRRALRKKSNVPESSRSRNSSMMLLPGSRGPSTPGYGEEESMSALFGGRGSDDDDTTLVDKEEDLERGIR